MTDDYDDGGRWLGGRLRFDDCDDGVQGKARWRVSS